MTIIKAVYASPRKFGNTATLLDRVLEGIQETLPGALIEKIYLGEQSVVINPCNECYACLHNNGLCIITNDDFEALKNKLLAADAILFAAPIFFYGLNAKAKLFVDRCQAVWVKKYRLDGYKFGAKPLARKGFFISAGATKGQELFRGSLLTMRYFFDALDTELTDSLLCQGLDEENDATNHPTCLAEAFQKGENFGLALAKKS